jgi:hypothetical protein
MGCLIGLLGGIAGAVASFGLAYAGLAGHGDDALTWAVTILFFCLFGVPLGAGLAAGLSGRLLYGPSGRPQLRALPSDSKMDDEGHVREIQNELWATYKLKLELHPASELGTVPMGHRIIATVTHADGTPAFDQVGGYNRLEAAKQAYMGAQLLSPRLRSQASLEAEKGASDSDTWDEPHN